MKRSSGLPTPGITRRAILAGLPWSGAAMLLAACSTSTPASPAPTAAATQPVPAATQPASVVTVQSSQAAPTGAAAAPGQTRSGGTLVFARPNEGNGFDPGGSQGGPATEVEEQVYETLVRMRPVTPADVASGHGIGATLEPALAESWKSSADGLTWTFNLRKGVQFHDGTPLDADAVVLNIDRQLNQSNPYYFKGKMLNALINYSAVSSYRAVDPATVEIKLKYKFAPFLAAIAQPLAGIISPAALKKYGQDIAKFPVGTGPFRFVEWRPNESITFERNPTWWKGKTYLDKLVFQNVPDPSAETAQLQAGEVEMVGGIDPDSVPILGKDPNLVVYKTTGDLNGIKIRCDKKPFSDKRVRQALTYAIDRQTLTQTVYDGLGSVANSPLPPSYGDWDSTIPPIPYDPAKAKSLLAEAGYPDGFGMRVVSFNAPLTVNPIGGDKLAEALQPYWAKVGIQANIQSMDIAAWRAARLAGDFDLLMDGFEGSGDPDTCFYQGYHSDTYNTSGNATFYKDPKIDQLVNQGRTEYDPAKRKTIYAELQRYLYDLSLWIYVNFVDILMAAKKTVNNVQFGPAFSSRAFEQTWIAT